MASTAILDSPGAGSPGLVASPAERLEELFGELAELTGQRNAIDGRIVEVVAEIDRDELWGATGVRSVAALVAVKTGSSAANAKAIANIAHRRESFPRCTEGMLEGRLSLDQVGVIASRAADGSDEHYAELAAVATVGQLRTAVAMEPRPDPGPRPDPRASIAKTSDDWEDGGLTELFNLVLLCPHHHRQHYRGVITITGPADRLRVTDSDGQLLAPGSLARPPSGPPPTVPPCPGSTGERADWRWYTPFQGQAPPTNN